MQYQIIATTLKGLEEVLARELYQLGATNVEIKNRAVSFTGDDNLLYACNIHLRTAIRVLKPVLHFDFTTNADYYQQIYDFPWENYFRVDQTFAIDFTVHSEMFNSTQFAALRMKDAIVDRFRNIMGDRPSVDIKAADIRLNLHITYAHADIALDSSGEPLFKRGYRNSKHEAPLNEVLAAGMVMLSGWDMQTGFFDPMCGSGTLPIEAGLIANNIAPGLIRKEFAFKNWPDYNKNLYRQIMLQAVADIKNSRVFIDGSDIDNAYIAAAKENAMHAQLNGKSNFFAKAFEVCDPPVSSKMVIINPPYGHRIGSGDITEFYKKIGDVLKQKYTGKTVWLLSSNMDALKSIGLKPTQKIPLFNGALECRFVRFDIYAGSKRMPRQAE